MKYFFYFTKGILVPARHLSLVQTAHASFSIGVTAVTHQRWRLVSSTTKFLYILFRVITAFVFYAFPKPPYSWPDLAQ